MGSKITANVFLLYSEPREHVCLGNANVLLFRWEKNSTPLPQIP